MKFFLFFLLMIFSYTALSYVDLNLSYTHSMRKIDGVETDSEPEPGSAVTTSNGYSVNWAWYIWEQIALELNYAKTEQKLTDDRKFTLKSGIDILKVESLVTTEVNGVGLRIAFANRKAAIIPNLSLGYARYTTFGVTEFEYDDDGAKGTAKQERDKEVTASGYAAFSVRLRLTELMGFTLAAKTIMPDFNTSLAGDNVTYSAGFSWIF